VLGDDTHYEVIVSLHGAGEGGESGKLIINHVLSAPLCEGAKFSTFSHSVFTRYEVDDQVKAFAQRHTANK
jgi:hypothetical protein